MNTILIVCVALAALLACEARCPTNGHNTGDNSGDGNNGNNNNSGGNNDGNNNGNNNNSNSPKIATSDSVGAVAGKNITSTTWTDTKPNGSTSSITQVKADQGAAATGGGSLTAN